MSIERIEPTRAGPTKVGRQLLLAAVDVIRSDVSTHAELEQILLEMGLEDAGAAVGSGLKARFVSLAKFSISNPSFDVPDGGQLDRALVRKAEQIAQRRQGSSVANDPEGPIAKFLAAMSAPQLTSGEARGEHDQPSPSRNADLGGAAVEAMGMPKPDVNLGLRGASLSTAADVVNPDIAEALEAVAACKDLVEDYARRLDEACEEYYKTGKAVFPRISRAEDEDTDLACAHALEVASRLIPDAKARWASIKYPIDQYDEQVERLRDIWVRRRNLLRVLERTLAMRRSFAQHSAAIGREQPMADPNSERSIIIHGHDERNLLALKDILVSKLKLPEPIIMAQQTIPGASLPEKFEQLASKVGYAVALLTPDDVGRANSSSDLLSRPRQNTLVEIGWFWGRLGRERILLLVKKELELPSDLQGVEYHRFEAKVEEMTEKIRDFYEAHRRHR